MSPALSRLRRLAIRLGLLTAGVLLARSGQAAEPHDWQPLYPEWSKALQYGASGGDSSPGGSGPRPRVQLFRFQTGYLSDVVGLDQDDPPDPFAGPIDNGPDWVQLSVGNDNPYFEPRRPGDPGGVGYYRFCSQAQFLETRTTSCTVGLQAVTPAGLESDGVATGDTVVMPGFAFCHALDDGTAFQGFVGQHIHVDSGLQRQNLARRCQAGMAVQRPLWLADADGQGGLFFFVETLGRYRYDPRPTLPQSTWEVLPGLHLRMNEKMWLSGAYVMPYGPTRTDGNQWQLTCSFQF
jgi:hypothetical protein